MQRRYTVVAAAALAAVLILALGIDPAFAQHVGRGAAGGAQAKPDDIGERIFEWFSDIGIWVLLIVVAGVGIGAAVAQKWPILLSAVGFALIVGWFLLAPESVRDLIDGFAKELR